MAVALQEAADLALVGAEVAEVVAGPEADVQLLAAVDDAVDDLEELEHVMRL
ncbi:hypothetical protein [Nannocystis sp.]|uniref:hypothetical protein n=1 Tax=Nannocystis sp. TaxID=1962667 RepID=UPI0025E7E895|nr:hypothetical protein [Nannocystis sp.]MBK7829966.1 hypothetical protein [Nannocystis sp.]